MHTAKEITAKQAIEIMHEAKEIKYYTGKQKVIAVRFYHRFIYFEIVENERPVSKKRGTIRQSIC